MRDWEGVDRGEGVCYDTVEGGGYGQPASQDRPCLIECSRNRLHARLGGGR